MGEEGFSSRLVAALPPRRPVGDRRRREVWELADLATTAEPPAQAAPPEAARAVRRRRPDDVDVVTGRRLVLGNGDVRISYVVGERALAAVPQRDRRRVRVTSSAAPASVETVFGALRVPRRRLRDHPARDHAPLDPERRDGRLRRYASRRTATSRRPSATCRGSASCSSTRRTASATCARRPSPLLVGGHRRRGLIKHRGNGPERHRRHAG